MEDALNRLIHKGPNPHYSMKSLLLTRIDDIRQARQLMRTWAEITVALGFDVGRSKNVAGCYARVEKQIAAGKLRLPQKPHQARQTGNSGFINLDKI